MHIIRKEPENDCKTALTWTPEGDRKRGRPNTTWRRRGEEPDGNHGIMCAPRRQIEKVGDRILRPYVTLGTKRKGEGEVKVNLFCLKHLHIEAIVI